MASADGEYKCSVSGLTRTATDQTLHDAFSRFGDIVEAKVVTDKDTGTCRGFGYVTFKDEKALEDAIGEMNGNVIDGHKIVVDAQSSQGRSFGREGRGGAYGGALYTPRNG